MKKQWNILRKLSGNNRGSGIVVVLVSMTCIALMGASLLFMSYTAVRMRATERQASRDFYSAEKIMDEIRADVQSIASNALGKAYKTVLTTYSEGGQMNQLFADAFVAELKKTGLINSSATQYDPTVLFNSVSGRQGVTVSGTGTVNNSDTSRLVLKDITVTYKAGNNYTTTISSDISIGMPDFAYVLSGNSLAGLPEHALIANEKLEQISKSKIKIDGSAYVGSLNLQTAESQLTISNGTLVCAGDAIISGKTTGGRLVTDNKVKFWANRIKVTDSGTLILDGETRVLDDLELADGESYAQLRGSYYGFGDGTVPTSNDVPANYSSAILINGLDCTLDLSGLKNLMLAGRSYISDSLYSGAGSGTAATRVGMLESIAVRSNQQMYLFDPADFEVLVIDDKGTSSFKSVDQNPFITGESNFLTKDESNKYTRIRLTEEAQQRADRYGYKLTARQYAYPGGQYVVYCFMEFATVNAANAYFEETFAKNKGQINSYLSNDKDTNAEVQYSNLNIGADGSISTYGYAISGQNGSYTLSQPTRTQFNPKGMRDTFAQMKKTLIDYNTRVSPDITPFTYIVDTEKVKSVEGEKYFYGDDENDENVENDVNDPVLGVIVNGNYIIDGDTPTSLRLVIATGTVTVKAHYNGLIMSGKTITLEGITGTDETQVVKHDQGGVNAAFAASAVGNPRDTMATYLLHGVNKADESVVSGGVAGWDLDALITYKNWTKK